MSMISSEKVLTKREFGSLLDGINHKKIIKYTSIGIAGVSISKAIVANSRAVDKFFLKDLPMFLSRSDYRFMSYLHVPNWFSVFTILSLIICTIADYKIAKNAMFEAKRTKNRIGG